MLVDAEGDSPVVVEEASEIAVTADVERRSAVAVTISEATVVVV